MSFLTSNSASSLEISPEQNNLLPGGFHLTNESGNSLTTGQDQNHLTSGHTYDFMSDSKLISTSDIIAPSIQAQPTQQSKQNQFKRVPANKETQRLLIEALSSSDESEPVKDSIFDHIPAKQTADKPMTMMMDQFIEEDGSGDDYYETSQQ